MQPNHNTKIGILFLLFLIITILFYTQYLASNSNNQSLSTSAKTYNQSPAPTCAPPPRRCPQGGTCNAQSKTCVTLSPTGSQQSAAPTCAPPPQRCPGGGTCQANICGTSPSSTVAPNTSLPILKEGEVCQNNSSESLGICDTSLGLYCSAGSSKCNKKSNMGIFIIPPMSVYDSSEYYTMRNDGTLLFTNIDGRISNNMYSLAVRGDQSGDFSKYNSQLIVEYSCKTGEAFKKVIIQNPSLSAFSCDMAKQGDDKITVRYWILNTLDKNFPYQNLKPDGQKEYKTTVLPPPKADLSQVCPVYFIQNMSSLLSKIKPMNETDPFLLPAGKCMRYEPSPSTVADQYIKCITNGNNSAQLQVFQLLEDQEEVDSQCNS